VSFQQVADLASSRTFVLRSAFRPTYNMTANLVRRYREEEAHRMLNLSFGQFQTDGAVVRMEVRLRRRRSEVDEWLTMLTAMGTTRDRVEARRDELRAERDEHTAAGAPLRPEQINELLSRLRPGDVLALPGERAVVLSVAYRRAGNVRVRLVDGEARTLTIGAEDLDSAPAVVATVALPQPFAPNSASYQREVAGRLRTIRARKVAGKQPRDDKPARRAPRGRYAEEFHVLDQIERAEREIADVDARVRAQSESLAKRFDDVLGLLRTWGYVEGWRLSTKGEQLVRIFHECDLPIAEALARGVFDDVDPATLAGLVSCFTYEHRSPTPPPPPWFPSATVRVKVEQLGTIVDELNAMEMRRRIPATRGIDPSFFALAHAWAAGNSLETVLDDEDVSGGDFVRNIRQLVDLLRQLAQAADSPATATAARQAAEAIQRGVVLASSMVEPVTPPGTGAPAAGGRGSVGPAEA
jgi:ATP-dependent RNA helicase HelY